jgi:hypothetical protein
VLPDGVDIISIVWRDNLNRTVALDTTQVHLPALAPLLEASVANTEQCNSGCDWSYHVSIHSCAQQRLLNAVTDCLLLTALSSCAALQGSTRASSN